MHASVHFAISDVAANSNLALKSGSVAPTWPEQTYQRTAAMIMTKTAMVKASWPRVASRAIVFATSIALMTGGFSSARAAGAAIGTRCKSAHVNGAKPPDRWFVRWSAGVDSRLYKSAQQTLRYLLRPQLRRRHLRVLLCRRPRRPSKLPWHLRRRQQSLRQYLRPVLTRSCSPDPRPPLRHLLIL